MRPQVRSLPSPHLTSTVLICSFGFPGNSDSEEFACSAEDPGLTPGWEDPWRRAWQPTPVFSPGESHEQRSLMGYSLWGHRESDMTEQLGSSSSSSWGGTWRHQFSPQRSGLGCTHSPPPHPSPSPNPVDGGDGLWWEHYTPHKSEVYLYITGRPGKPTAK